MLVRGLLSFLVFITVSGAAFASAGSVVFWQDVSDADKAIWQKEGYDVVALGCAANDHGCVSKGLSKMGAAEKRLLIADSPSSKAVFDLFALGLDTDSVTGVAMMRAVLPNDTPVTVSPSAPKLTVFVEKSDEARIVTGAQRFATAFRQQGVTASVKFFDPDMMAAQPVHPGVVMALSHFMGYAPRSELLMKLLTANELWPNLGHNNKGFLAQTDFVTRKPMTEPVRAFLKRHFGQGPHVAKQWAFESYLSFDLLAYRDTVAPGQKYVSFNTRLNQYMVVDLDQYAAYGPEIVVGVDDETNMYQLAWYYWNDLMYSWDTKVPNISAKPLGPALVFTKPVPEDLALPFRQRTALHFKGMSFSNDDPLIKMKSYPPTIQTVITKGNECIYCHSIEGVGGRNHHLNAYTAQPQGGVALALEEYSDTVMREFLFNQEEVAAKVGLSPNPVGCGMSSKSFMSGSAPSRKKSRKGTTHVHWPLRTRLCGRCRRTESEAVAYVRCGSTDGYCVGCFHPHWYRA